MSIPDSWVELSELTVHLYTPPVGIIWWSQGQYDGRSPTSSKFVDILRSNDLPFSNHHMGLLLTSRVLSRSLLCFSHMDSHFCTLANAIFLSIWCPSWPLVCCQTSTYRPNFSSNIISLLKFVCSWFLCISSFLPFGVGQSLSPIISVSISHIT